MKAMYLTIVALVTAFAGMSFSAEPKSITLNGKTVWMITEGNVDPNTGKTTWAFESGRDYVLVNDIKLGLWMQDVNNVRLDMGGFAVRGDWKGKGNLDCSLMKTESEAIASGCLPFYQCKGGSSSTEYCRFYAFDEDSCNVLGGGCSWNAITLNCDGFMDCSSLTDYDCPAIGCSNGAFVFNYGIIQTPALHITKCSNVSVKGGRLLGFFKGIHIVGSSDVRLTGVTSVGMNNPIFIQASAGSIDVSDCIFAVIKGNVSGSFSATNADSIVVDKSVFVGGKVSANSKMVAFSDCQFEPAPAAIFTEVVGGKEVNRAFASLPAGFNVAEFVSYMEKSGVIFFGTTWCGYCAKQKSFFGDVSISSIYFDCTMTGDPITDQQKKNTMAQFGVKSFPAWRMPDGKLYPGLKSIAELVELSGYGKNTSPRTRTNEFVHAPRRLSSL